MSSTTGLCFCHLWWYTKAQAPLVRFLMYLSQTCLYNTSTTKRRGGVWALQCVYVLITDRWRSVSQCALIITCSACCLVISLSVQCAIHDFAWDSVARSIGVSRYACFNYRVTYIIRPMHSHSQHSMCTWTYDYRCLSHDVWWCFIESVEWMELNCGGHDTFQISCECREWPLYRVPTSASGHQSKFRALPVVCAARLWLHFTGEEWLPINVL